MVEKNPIFDVIVKRVQTYRRKKGLSQEQLADLAELHPTYIGQIESGEKNMSITSLAKILDALDISFSEFFTGLDSPTHDMTVATKCYDLIIEQKSGAQDEIYDILRCIDRLMTYHGR